jgi:hypothetical protein
LLTKSEPNNGRHDAFARTYTHEYHPSATLPANGILTVALLFRSICSGRLSSAVSYVLKEQIHSEHDDRSEATFHVMKFVARAYRV